MRLSLRTQVVLLVGVVLLVAMGLYAALASRFVRADKEATVYDSDALVAATVAEQVDRAVEGIAAKLRYFGEEYDTTPGDAERRARSLVLADPAVLSLQVLRRGPGGFERRFLLVDQPRLAALNLTADDLAHAARQTPLPAEAVARAGLLVQNTSLPPDLALVRVAAATAGGEVVVAADLRPEWLLSAVSASRLYRVFLVDGLGRALAHPEAEKVIGHADLATHPAVRNALGAKVARGAEEYQAPSGAYLSAWAKLAGGLGAVVVEVPRDQVLKAADELLLRSLFFAAGALGVALVLAVLLGRRVTRPLADLETAMAGISRGELGLEAPVAGPTEIRSVGAALNSMSRELVRRSEELQRTHAQLVQSEKLSAVGELAASVVHEVKNPMVGIVGFAQLAQEAQEAGKPAELQEYLKLIEEDAFRANGILQGLLEFARPPEVERERLEVNEVVHGTLQLCRHQLQMGGVKIETALQDGLPPVRGNSNQLRQVLLNLMLNAGQAMERSEVRRLQVSTAGSAAGGVELRVADSGPGIAPEIRDQLFRPFITTKRRGSGTGLGLSVSRSIVEAHGGSIRAESQPGAGATFVVTLPPAPPA